LTDEAPAPLAVLYDVHGNRAALTAVLDDARAADAVRFVLGGDYALFGAFPAETVDVLRGLDAVWIRGNTDRWLENASDAPAFPLVARSLEACRAALGDERVTALAHLDESALVDGVRFCHASPRSDMATFMPQASELDGELLEDSDEDVVVFGHSHLQFMRPAGRHTLVNPGSVGLPFDGERTAAYALWRGGGGFELRRVAYDTERYAADVRERLGPTLGETVGTLSRRVEQAAFVE
jgi:predicted phosphodiesterase